MSPNYFTTEVNTSADLRGFCLTFKKGLRQPWYYENQRAGETYHVGNTTYHSSSPTQPIPSMYMTTGESDSEENLGNSGTSHRRL